MISHGVVATEDKVAKKNIINHNHNNNNMKHPSLKRVSFGSSKGSMVETLIYDHPLPEEDNSYYEANITRFGTVLNQKTEPDPETKRIEAQIRPPSKVRVTFYESEKPHYVSSPDSGDAPLDFDIAVMSTPSPTQDRTSGPGYIRQLSTDSGKDNPFRPDGDLSKEADQIVEMIKEGRPITLTPTPELPEDKYDGADHDDDDHLNHHFNNGSPGGVALVNADGSPVRGGGGDSHPAVTETHITPTKAGSPVQHAAAAKPGANGNAKSKSPSAGSPTNGAGSPGAVEVQRGVVVPPSSDAMQVEHVVLKKKPKCKCCVVM